MVDTEMLTIGPVSFGSFQIAVETLKTNVKGCFKDRFVNARSQPF